MRKVSKRVLSVFLALALVFTGIPSVPGFSSQLKTAKAAGMTYVRESEMDDLAQLMDEFGFIVFDTLHMEGHQHSNVMADKFSSNGGQGTDYCACECTIRDGLNGSNNNYRNNNETITNYIRTLTGLSADQHSIKLGYSQDTLIVGTGHNVSASAGTIDGHAVVNSKVEQDSSDSQYVNFEELKKNFSYYSGQLAEKPETVSLVNGAANTADVYAALKDDNNNPVLEVKTSDLCVLNLTAADFSRTGLDGRPSIATRDFTIKLPADSKGLLINVDMSGASELTISKLHVEIGGRAVILEGSVAEGIYATDDNRIMWNFYDSSDAAGNYSGNIHIMGSFLGSIIAPHASLKADTGINGMAVVNSARVPGESHRANNSITDPLIAPITADTADFSLIKTFADADLTAMSEQERKALLENTEFTLYEADGMTVAAGPCKLVWNSEEERAEVVFEDVKCDLDEADSVQYILKETKAPEGYKKSDVTVDCSVRQNPKTGLPEVYYKKSGEDDSAYSRDFPEFDNVKKQEITPVVSIDNWTFGEDASEPSVSGNDGNGTETFEYKEKGADDSTYTTTQPTNAGEYVVRVKIGETDEYMPAVSEETEFRINKADNTITADSETAEVMRGGKELDLSELVSGDIGSVSYEIIGDANGCSMEAGGKLISGDTTGTVTIRVTATGDANHEAGYVDIKITVTDKSLIEPSVTIEGWDYGTTANSPKLAKDSNPGNGQVTYEYKKKGADDNTYTTTVPENAGDYTVRATVAETADYEGGSATCDFTINKVKDPAEVTNEVSVTRQGTVDLNGLVIGAVGTVSFDIISTNAHGSRIGRGNIFHTAPRQSMNGYWTGDIEVEVTIADSENHVGRKEKITIHIKDKATIHPTVQIEGWEYLEYSEEVNKPFLTQGSNPGGGAVTYEYKKVGADDDTYTTTVPEDAGRYIVRATIEETLRYCGGQAVAEFEITKAEDTAVISTKDKDTEVTVNTLPSDDHSLDLSDFVKDAIGEVTYEIVSDGTEATDAHITDGKLVPGTKTGDVKIKVTVADSDNHTGKEEIITIKVVPKAQVTPAVTMEGWKYGENAKNPSLTEGSNPGNGTVNYEYKVKGADDSTYTTTKPSDAGDYVVRAKVGETAEYAEGVSEGTEFSIKRAEVTVKVNNSEKFFGNKDPDFSAVVEGLLNGDEIEYTLNRANGESVGNYTIFANGAQVQGNYEVSYTSGVLEIKPVANEMATDDAEESVMRDGKTIDLSGYAENANGDVTYEIVSDDDLDCSVDENGIFTTGNTTGEVTVKVKASGDKNHNAAERTITVTITDKENITIDVSETTADYDGSGKTVEVTVKDESGKEIVPDDDDIIVEYKKTTDDDDAYTTTAPTEAGEYDVRVTVKETEDHNGKTVVEENALIINKIADPAVVTTDGGAVKINENPDDDNSIDLDDLVSGAEGEVHYEIIEDETTATGTTIDDDNNLIPGSEPGTVKVKVTIDESENHKGKETVITITVTEKDVKDLTVSTEDGTYGDKEPVEPSFTEPEGTNKTTITYSGTTEGGDEYGPSTEPPTEAGRYVVTVTCETPDTIYTGSSDFTIEKATPELGTVTAENLHETTDVKDVTISRTDTTVPGEFVLEETVLEKGTNTYHYTFTPEDTANYKTVTGTVSITVTEHQWGDWYVVEEATTEKDGLKRRDCDLCDEYETEVIPKVQKENPKPDDPNQDNPNQDDPNQDDPNQDNPNQDNPNQDNPNQDNPNQDNPNQDNPKQDEPKQDEPKQDEPKQDEPKQDEPKQDQPKQDEPKQDEPKQDTPAESGNTNTNPPQGTGTGEGGTATGQTDTSTDTAKSPAETPATDTSKSTDTAPVNDTSKSTNTPATDTSGSTDTSKTTDTSKSTDTPATDTSKSTDTSKTTDTSKKTDTPTGTGEMDTKTPKTGDAGLLVWWFALLGAATVVLMVRRQQAEEAARKADE